VSEIYSNAFLKLCQKAKDAGYPLRVEIGSFVGRGFADLGLELFACLPGNKLLSLMTGKQTNCMAEDHRHLFSVPTVDKAIIEFEGLGFKVTEITRIDNREFKVALEDAEGRLHSAVESDLLSALLEAYCHVCSS
jgi:hypothetical protein